MRILFIGLLLTSASLSAQVTTNLTTGPYQTHSVSATDLANSGQLTFSSIVLDSGTTARFDSNVAKLVDGSMYGGANYDITAQTFVPLIGARVFITFNTSVNTLGYDISSFDMVTGHGTDQDRSNQNFSVSFAAPGSSTYTNAINVFTNAAATALTREIRTHTYDGSGFLATGVGSLQITFADTASPLAAEMMYREFDVAGVAAIPEPSTWGVLVGAAALGMVLIRRRRQLA